MTSLAARFARGLFPVLLAPSLAACGSSAPKSGFAPGSDAGLGDAAAADGAPGDGGDTFGEGGLLGDGSLGKAVSLAITPGKTSLTVTDLKSPPTATLVAKVTYSGGAVQTVPTTWSVDRFDILSVDAGGVVTPSAQVFGSATVTAKAAGLTATAAVTVSAALVVHDMPTISGATEKQLTGATTADPGVTGLAYPYDGTVFPLGLMAPEVQWNGGAAGDAYLVHFTAPDFDLQIFTTADPPSRTTLSSALWSILTSTAAGSTTSVALSRSSGGEAYASAKQTWTVANADLRGIIYYWAINEGQIDKLDLSDGTVSPVITAGSSTVLGTPVPLDSSSPDTPPWEDNGMGSRCVACHSVSKDGSTLSSVFSRDQPGSTGPLGFASLGNDQISVIADYLSDTTYDALSPTGAFAVANYSNKTMGLLSPATGAALASALDGQVNLCDPTFSPDGTLFALASGCDPGFGYPVEFRTSNLTVYSFASTPPTFFTNPITVETSAGLGDAIAFPSFSPDSKWLFYQRGDYSRAKYTNTSSVNVHGNDNLYVAAVTASAPQIALANLNGSASLPAVDQNLNYAPTVNPIAVGGYFWVVFTSPRDYGNEMVAPGTTYPNDPTYANRKQLWVAAVDANIGTTDPSHPPFWLPGQVLTTANMFGYWALAPCEATGKGGDGGSSTCKAGYECCSGYCSGGSCVAKSQSGCSELGDKCTTAAECCLPDGGTALGCIGGFCEPQRPQ